MQKMTPDIEAGMKIGTLLTPGQIAYKKDVSPRSVTRAMERGQLPGFKIETTRAVKGYIWVAYADDVDAWVPTGPGRPRKTPVAAAPHPSRFKNCPSEKAGPSDKDIAKGRALYAAREAKRAEYAAKIPERPRPQFGDYRPALWPGMI